VPDTGVGSVHRARNDPEVDERENVVLVNGLWLADPALWLLARRLRRTGFHVHTFSYPSVRHDLRTNAARLHEFLARVPGATVHLVGYSLGGLIIRALFHFQPPQRPGRIVLLGSPQSGNRAAQTMALNRFGRALLGRAVAELIVGTPQRWNWPARETGVIAGSRSLGLGRLVARLAIPNDGSVAVEETVVPGPHAGLVLPVAHFALLLAPAVARQVARFLRFGAFEPAR
jgi:alpha-beta hydrolase superfamily lysophospholipase